MAGRGDALAELAANGPPRPDQIEISVFGPNYGECIVVLIHPH
jgi:hypothetical protein